MNRVAIAILAVALLAPVIAISSPENNPMWGTRLAVNVANWHGDDAVGSEARIGLSGGVTLAYALGRRISIEGEALYTMKGATSNQGGVRTLVRLNYLEVPVLLRFDVAAEGLARPYMLFGPSVALEVRSTVERDSAGVRTEVETQDVCLDTKSPDIGLVFGAGVELVPARHHARVSLELRYTVGVVSINDSPGFCDRLHRDLGGPFDIKNDVLSVAIGLRH